MNSDSTFHSECANHRQTGMCILHALTNTPTLDVGTTAICGGCNLRVDDMQEAVALALRTPSAKPEKECDVLVEQMSSYFDAGNQPLRSATPLTVKQVGPYVVQERIGRGSMGTVYRARHQLLQRDFAIKVLDARGPIGSKTIKRFERETRSLGKVRHPNIVQATDAGQDNGLHYIAMEFLDGRNLSQLTKKRTLDVPTACELIRQAALGIHHAHMYGLVHRDIKPSNLMLCLNDDDYTVKVLDLGLVRTDPILDEDEEDLTPAGVILGTFGFMAPEQLEDPRNATVPSDIYSLGVVLWKLVTGESVVTDPPNSGLLTMFPEELQTVVASAVASPAENRPASAKVLSEAMEPFASTDGLPALLK